MHSLFVRGARAGIASTTLGVARTFVFGLGFAIVIDGLPHTEDERTNERERIVIVVALRPQINDTHQFIYA